MDYIEPVLECIKELGLTKGLFVVFFLMMHAWVFALYRGRLKDRGNEIERLAADNHHYRECFLYYIDKQMGHNPDGDDDDNKIAK